MMSLRLIVPSERTALVVQHLDADDRTTNVVALAGAAVRPKGDLVQCEVTREAASDVLGWLRRQGIYDDGSVVLAEVTAAPSRNARTTEIAARGAPDDAVVWDAVLDSAYGEVRGSWSFYAFLTLAVAIAAVAVITDSSILVVGAMVVGPEFGVVAALAVGIAALRRGLVVRAVLLLVKGFGVAIVAVVILGLLARWAGWISLDDVTGARPLRRRRPTPVIEERAMSVVAIRVAWMYVDHEGSNCHQSPRSILELTPIDGVQQPPVGRRQRLGRAQTDGSKQYQRTTGSTAPGRCGCSARQQSACRVTRPFVDRRGTMSSRSARGGPVQAPRRQRRRTTLALGDASTAVQGRPGFVGRHLRQRCRQGSQIQTREVVHHMCTDAS